MPVRHSAADADRYEETAICVNGTAQCRNRAQAQNCGALWPGLTLKYTNNDHTVRNVAIASSQGPAAADSVAT